MCREVGSNANVYSADRRCRTGGAHTTGLSLGGLSAGQYEVIVDGKRVAVVQGGEQTTAALPVAASPAVRVAIVRQ